MHENILGLPSEQFAMLVIWILVIIIALVVEIATTGVYSILISISAIPSLIISLVTKQNLGIILTEVFLFLGFSVLSTVLFFHLGKKISKNKTNYPVQELLNKEGMVIEIFDQIKDDQVFGIIIVEGKKYRAKRPTQNTFFSNGDLVIIEAISGNTLSVIHKK
ncbi:NfeD family protein [Mycoplasma crocodyli]|uniref:NfeD family protein n=1 Tax=Mycoplasma crocodyli TaxID=50052 RepID=UPI0003066E79|nr:NfeD family protein [Mycoplasma crocodyli]